MRWLTWVDPPLAEYAVFLLFVFLMARCAA